MKNDANRYAVNIKRLRIHYQTRNGPVKAGEDISFKVRPREVFGLVGESGCGKSTIGQAILRILPDSTRVEGQILLDDEDILKYKREEMRKIRGEKVSMIFQDPMTSLNPIMKVKDHFMETINTHKPKIKKEKAIDMIKKALDAVGIESDRLNEYPFQFSGGMRQRTMIALALIMDPTIIVADEPTTSLDVIVQAQILKVLEHLKQSFNSSMLLITHDMGVVADMADRIGVMYGGQLVEENIKDKIYKEPKHPYTMALLGSIPNTDIKDMHLSYIPGAPPDLLNHPERCRFAPRCPKAMKKCWDETPHDFVMQDGGRVRCWLFENESKKKYDPDEVGELVG